jgi:hypothetical protein
MHSYVCEEGTASLSVSAILLFGADHNYSLEHLDAATEMITLIQFRADLLSLPVCPPIVVIVVENSILWGIRLWPKIRSVIPKSVFPR